ncbi:MAG: ANTAR domain-containing protein [Gammaproteobacteria bacterium]|jgi:hypothetical protein|nr:ANTAR domain-containing protein [Gammaproteobacteria bacterium]MDH3971021.1 ANTAR domain-containing protein [Gammaproteobacteria bacterium]MDH3985766.1 ANTAR domain-containing protein [Gammaproteobacteria bacterium]
MNLLAVSERPGQSTPHIKAACKAGWQISAECGYQQLSIVLTDLQADAALLIAPRIDDAILKKIRLLNSICFLPVVLFTEDALQISINDAVKARGIIMRQRGVNENTAYQLLRKLSMDRNRRIG